MDNQEINSHKVSPVLLGGVALVLLLGVIAIYAQNKKSDVATVQSTPSASPLVSPTSSSTAISTPTPTASTVAGVPTATANTQTFLVIKDLGIKLPLTDPIKDLTYNYTCTNGGGSTTTNCLHFSTASIQNISNSNSGSRCSDPLGTYNVYSSRQSNEGSGDNQAGTLETSANGHYIYYHHAQSPCGDSPQDESKVNSLVAPLLTAVQQALPN